MRTLHSTTLLALVVSAACAQNDGDVDRAAQGWRAANVALADGTAELEEQVDVDGNGDVTVGCPGGGQVRVAGTYAVEVGEAGEHVAVEADVDFDGCVAEGISIDGSLHMRSEVHSTDHSTTIDLDYSGSLQWSGEIEGDCDIDMEGHIATETSGNEVDVRIELSGSVCGADANAVVESAGG